MTDSCRFCGAHTKPEHDLCTSCEPLTRDGIASVQINRKAA